MKRELLNKRMQLAKDKRNPHTSGLVDYQRIYRIQKECLAQLKAEKAAEGTLPKPGTSTYIPASEPGGGKLVYTPITI